jgi:hypothetical protein
MSNHCSIIKLYREKRSDKGFYTVNKPCGVGDQRIPLFLAIVKPCLYTLDEVLLQIEQSILREEVLKGFHMTNSQWKVDTQESPLSILLSVQEGCHCL